VSLVHEADFNAVLTEELVHFQLPGSQPQDFTPYIFLGCAAALGYE
jgi:hypothetical protein